MDETKKPFDCKSDGCGMSFTNEDHLTVHTKKHAMVLQLSLGQKVSSFVGTCYILNLPKQVYKLNVHYHFRLFKLTKLQLRPVSFGIVMKLVSLTTYICSTLSIRLTRLFDVPSSPKVQQQLPIYSTTTSSTFCPQTIRQLANYHHRRRLL